jgi:hypothetical protein
MFPAVLLMGCSETDSVTSSSSSTTEVTPVVHQPVPEAKPAGYEFEPALLLTAADEPIEVEEPGYACPTLFDMDKDGAEDLIVGQFNSGKMKWYRNLSSPGEMPKYAKGEWVSTEDSPAEVPGVS